MPPIRSLPLTKPIKTERTHEENQERAYIAASRRSDRSLEARIESARRASEIHKRRTGRSLRVTEQDVINEEMYEEEDDDLPLQYRRLTAQFNTTDPTFNRRLAAYLTNHVAINNAMNQAMGNQFNQPFGDNSMAQPWAQGFNNPMQQQMQHQMWQQQLQQQQQQQMNNSSMMPPMMPNNNNNSNSNSNAFRQSPYPQPFQMQMQSQAFRPSMQSMPSQNMSQQQTVSNMTADDQRRMSAPAQPISVAPSPKTTTTQSSGLSAVQRTTSSASLPSLTTQTTQTSVNSRPTPPDGKTNSPLSQTQNMTSSPFAQGMWNQNANNNMDTNLFSSTLPAETQMFLGANVGGPAMNDLFSGNPLAMNVGDQKLRQPFYSYNPNNFSNKGRNMHPSFDGMSQTLAPGALTGDAFSWSTPQSATTLSTDSVSTPSFTGAFPQSLGQSFNDLIKFNQFDFQSPIAQTSGFVTPGEAEWATYIDSSNWDDNTVTTST